MPNRVQLTPAGEFPSAFEIISLLAEGNVGAVTVLAQWMKFGAQIDPDCALPPHWAMCMLDDMDLVGPRIWVLYKDVCGQDIRRFLGVLRAHQLGFLSEMDLQAAAGRDYPTALRDPQEVDALLARVEDQLPAFMKADAWRDFPVSING